MSEHLLLWLALNQNSLVLITGTRPPLSRCFKEVATSKFLGDARNRKEKRKPQKNKQTNKQRNKETDIIHMISCGIVKINLAKLLKRFTAISLLAALEYHVSV